MEKGAALTGAQVLLPRLCVPHVWKQPLHVPTILATQADSHAHSSDVCGEDIEITQKGCAASGAVPCRSDTRGTPEQAREYTSPTKNHSDKQVSSWRHISCHTDKNRYYT